MESLAPETVTRMLAPLRPPGSAPRAHEDAAASDAVPPLDAPAAKVQREEPRESMAQATPRAKQEGSWACTHC